MRQVRELKHQLAVGRQRAAGPGEKWRAVVGLRLAAIGKLRRSHRDAADLLDEHGDTL
jgi:hypothetical protein